MLFVITVLTSVFTSIIAAIFAGLFIHERSTRVEVRQEPDLPVPEVSEWLKSPQTPEAILARMKTISSRSTRTIVQVQKAVEQGVEAPQEQLQNTLRSVDKAANAVLGLLQSLKISGTTTSTQEITTTAGFATQQTDGE